MVDPNSFKPKTVYVTYIAAPAETVWRGLTDPAFTRQYFGGFAVDVEPKRGFMEAVQQALAEKPWLRTG